MMVDLGGPGWLTYQPGFSTLLPQEAVRQPPKGVLKMKLTELEKALMPFEKKLKALVDVLNSLNVSAEDMIAIIRTLEAQGAIYGDVVYQ